MKNDTAVVPVETLREAVTAYVASYTRHTYPADAEYCSACGDFIPCNCRLAPLRAALSTPVVGPSALDLVAAERRRQVEGEGWSTFHDDEHTMGEMASAAACYAMPHEDRDYREGHRGEVLVPRRWPWARKWWKPAPDDRIRELVKAGALIVAEIERLQRAAPNIGGGQ